MPGKDPKVKNSSGLEVKKSPSIVVDSARSDGKATQAEGQKKQRREFYKEELRRLTKSLKKEQDKIIVPPIKEHIPYVFNNLEPYFDVSHAKYIVKLREEPQQGYSTRQTAISLCDPWDDLHMDLPTSLPRIESSRAVINTAQTKPVQGLQKDRPPKEGSTRLPRFPTVHVPAEERWQKTLYYSDVPALREELRKKYSSAASNKLRDDYTRTKQDFFRMELDRMEAYHPSTRPKMKSTYFAYLQNTPGSQQAVTECVEYLAKDQAAKATETSRKVHLAVS